MKPAARKMHFTSILRLKCPYCCKESLQSKGSWFSFQKGCPHCNYVYAREDGYFSGAPWMISYPLSSVLAFSLVFLIYNSEHRPSALVIALSVGVICAGFGILTYPFAKAIWMYVDHHFHPVEWHKESLSSIEEDVVDRS